MEEPAILYRGVIKDYVRSHLGRATVTRGLDGLDLEIRRGEIFGLLGLNGNGKTTAMKLALGLLRPTAGEVRVHGALPGAPETLARLGYLPELPYVYPYLTPREALEFYGRLSGLPREELAERVPRTLEAVGLAAAAGRKAGEFSKGMLQRLGLAQAILHRPEVLLLDEPVSGLDPLAVHDLREVFKRLNRDGATLVLSSHSISDVERLCHRAGILVRGRLVRVLEQKDWAGEAGRLERLFVETVRPGP